MSPRESTAFELITLVERSPAVLFDFNGTLSDDEKELEQAYRQALITMGLTPISSAEYANLLGMSEPDIAAALITARRGTAEQVNVLLAHVGTQYAEICARRPRVSAASVRMVQHLIDSGRQVGIVTGTLAHLIRPVLTQLGLLDALHTLVTIEDVSRGKPDPEGFLKAAATLGLSGTADLLVFEDSAAGVAAATTAGMNVVGIGAHSGTSLAFNSMDEVADLILTRI